jgi:hypothetical protein
MAHAFLVLEITRIDLPGWKTGWKGGSTPGYADPKLYSLLKILCGFQEIADDFSRQFYFRVLSSNAAFEITTSFPCFARITPKNGKLLQTWSVAT